MQCANEIGVLKFKGQAGEYMYLKIMKIVQYSTWHAVGRRICERDVFSSNSLLMLPVFIRMYCNKIMVCSLF